MGTHGADLFIVGEIKSGDAQTFEKAVSDPREKFLAVFLNSRGGDVYAAIEIGRIVRKHELTTDVRESSECFSSCALIYIAGVTRMNFGTIGLHRPILAGVPREEQQLPKAVSEMLGAIKSYVSEMGVTSNFFEAMVNTLPENMRLFSQSDIEELVPVKDPLYDELYIARQARQYGATTEEYRRRDNMWQIQCSINDKRFEKNDKLLEDCIEATRWGLSINLYRDRLAKAQTKCKLNAGDKLKLSNLPQKERQSSPIRIQAEKCGLNIMRDG